MRLSYEWVCVFVRARVGVITCFAARRDAGDRKGDEGDEDEDACGGRGGGNETSPASLLLSLLPPV